MAKKLFTLLDLCVSSLRRGHANLLCIVPILTDDPRRESKQTSGKDCRQGAQNTTILKRKKVRTGRTELWNLATNVTVAILAQGTSWAVAVTQAFLLPGSILGKRAWRAKSKQGEARRKAEQGRALAPAPVPLSVLSWPAGLPKGQAIHVPAYVGS